MSSLSVFLKEFYKNRGLMVFAALFVQKVSAFISTLIIVRLLSPQEFGLLSIVPAVFALFAPFTGLGLPVALLRFGPLLGNSEDRNALASKTLREGMFFQVILAFVFLLSGLFFVTKYEDILIIFLVYSVRLFGLAFLSHIQVYFRINFNNRNFSVVTICTAIIGLGLVILGTMFFGFKGYLVAVALTPFSALFWYDRRLFQKMKATFNFTDKSFYKFSLHSAFTNFGSELLFAADILILSFLLSETSVAAYKVAILIPANMVFLSQSFMQSDYPKIAANSKDSFFLKNYITQFLKIFIPCAFLIVLTGILLRKQIISVFFGSQYMFVSDTFIILLVAFSISMIFRVLFGNMLSAVGKMNLVTWTTFISVVILVAGALILVPLFQINGMAYSMLAALLFCSAFQAVLFKRELKKIK